MTITTKEAERFARWCDTDGFTERATALRSLAAERDALQAEIEKLREAPAPETIRLDPRTEWKLFRQMGPHELVTNASVPMLETKTLRDEFAMAVLTGLMADHTAPDRPPEFFADLAYKYANAMMEARKK
jgi:hypothetical protein